MFDFTIVVVCYNQEVYILEALESIKYQIQNYLGERSIQLVIADDGSTDNTPKKIKRWLESNNNIFGQVDVLLAEKNEGTCKNQARAYRKIKGKHFFCMAGDDTFTNVDVFSQMELCGAYDVVAHPVVHMKDYSILWDRKMYRGDCWTAFQNERTIRKQSKTSCPILNGGLIGCSLITEEALLFCEKFTLLEDQTFYVKMLEGKREFHYAYSNIPLIVYRHSDGQVTNRNNSTYKVIKEDIEKLTTYLLKQTKSIISKWQIQCACWRTTKPEVYTRFLRFCDISYYRNVVFKILFWKKGHKLIESLLKNVHESGIDEYILEIRDKANYYH